MHETASHSISNDSYQEQQDNFSKKTFLSIATCRVDVDDSTYEVSHNRIFGYFLRMSSIHKCEFAQILVHNVNSIESLKIILDTFDPITGKLHFYSKTLVENPFVYDRLLQDHDRMLDQIDLHVDIQQDARWFQNLPSLEQESLLLSYIYKKNVNFGLFGFFLALIRLGGGSVLAYFYECCKKEYKFRLFEEADKESDTTLVQKVPKKSISAQIFSSLISVTSNEANLALSAEREKQTQLWNEIVSNYERQIKAKEQLYNSKPEPTTKKETTKGNTKESKSKKKKKKESKTQEKSKKKPSTVNNNIILDRIQFMPVWIVKKILGYVDDETLRRAKHVNQYWEWVITDLMEDKKMKLFLKESCNHIMTHEQYASVADCEEAIAVPELKSPTQKRVEKLQKKGAAIENLIHQGINPTYNTYCVITEAIEAVFHPKLTPVYKRAPRIRSTCAKPSLICKDVDMIRKETQLDKAK